MNPRFTVAGQILKMSVFIKACESCHNTMWDSDAVIGSKSLSPRKRESRIKCEFGKCTNPSIWLVKLKKGSE